MRESTEMRRICPLLGESFGGVALRCLAVFGDELFCKHCVACGSAAFRVVEQSRQAMGWRFAQAYVARDYCRKYHVAEMSLEFLINLVGKAQAGVVHGKQEAFDFQLRVELRLYYAYCVEQFADTLEGEVFGLYGYDYRVGCRKGVDSDEAERRRAVDENIIVAFGHRAQHVEEYFFAVGFTYQFELGSCKVYARSDQIEPFDTCGCL